MLPVTQSVMRFFASLPSAARAALLGACDVRGGTEPTARGGGVCTRSAVGGCEGGLGREKSLIGAHDYYHPPLRERSFRAKPGPFWVASTRRSRPCGAA